MRTTTIVVAVLMLSCLAGGNLESQAARGREENPPVVVLSIDGRTAAGSGELRVSLGAAEKSNLVLVSAERQRVRIRGAAALLRTAATPQSTYRLQYEQRIREDGRRVYLALLPLAERAPANLVHLDWGSNKPVRREILPGLTLSQRDERDSKPDVAGGSALRTWLTVEVTGSEPPVTLEGGETKTISYRGVAYRLHVYRSLRRDPGTNPRLPFEGERYLLTATLTPQ